MDRMIKMDRESVIEIVRKNGLLLKHASKELKNDPEVVKEAVLSHHGSIKFSDLRKNQRFVALLGSELVYVNPDDLDEYTKNMYEVSFHDSIEATCKNTEVRKNERLSSSLENMGRYYLDKGDFGKALGLYFLSFEFGYDSDNIVDGLQWSLIEEVMSVILYEEFVQKPEFVTKECIPLLVLVEPEFRIAYETKLWGKSKDYHLFPKKLTKLAVKCVERVCKAAFPRSKVIYRTVLESMKHLLKRTYDDLLIPEEEVDNTEKSDFVDESENISSVSSGLSSPHHSVGDFDSSSQVLSSCFDQFKLCLLKKYCQFMGIRKNEKSVYDTGEDILFFGLLVNDGRGKSVTKKKNKDDDDSDEWEEVDSSDFGDYGNSLIPLMFSDVREKKLLSGWRDVSAMDLVPESYGVPQHKDDEAFNKACRWKKTGFGVEYTSVYYRRTNMSYCRRVFSGNFVNGIREGHGCEYQRGSKGYQLLKFDGYFRDGRRTSGKENEVANKIPKKFEFTGTWNKDGKRHGICKTYDPRTDSSRLGNWKDGELDKSSEYVVVEYEKIKSLLGEKDVISKGSGRSQKKVVYSVYKKYLKELMTLKRYSEIGDQVALMIIKVRNEVERDRVCHMIQKELRLSMNLTSTYLSRPCFVERYGMILGDEYVGIVMEKCENPVSFVLEKQGTFDVKRKLEILHTVSLGLEDLHRQGIPHRCLSWKNIFVDKDGNAALNKVGTGVDSTSSEEEVTYWRLQRMGKVDEVMTVGYRPPEIIAKGKYGLKSDVYVFGMMIYSLIFETCQPYSKYMEQRCDSICSCGKTLASILQQDEQGCYDTFERHVLNCGLRPKLYKMKKKYYKVPIPLIEVMCQCWEKSQFLRPSFRDIAVVCEMSNCLVLEGEAFSQELFCNITFKILSLLPELKMAFKRPCRRQDIIQWIEDKFGSDYNFSSGEDVMTMKVVSLEYVQECCEEEDEGEEEEEEKKKKMKIMILDDTRMKDATKGDSATIYVTLNHDVDEEEIRFRARGRKKKNKRDLNRPLMNKTKKEEEEEEDGDHDEDFDNKPRMRRKKTHLMVDSPLSKTVHGWEGEKKTCLKCDVTKKTDRFKMEELVRLRKEHDELVKEHEKMKKSFEDQSKEVDDFKHTNKRLEEEIKDLKLLKEMNYLYPKDLLKKKNNMFKIDREEIIENEKIGGGAFGMVYGGTLKIHKNVAIKKINFGEGGLDDYESQEKVLKEFYDQACLVDDKIVRTYGYCKDERTNEIGIIMERMDMNVFKFVKQNENLNLERKCILMKDMTRALNILHQRFPVILHRDVKSYNFLVSKDGSNVKICDFGCLTTVERGSSHLSHSPNWRGTTKWNAPEVLDERKYSVESDIYSLAITFWEVLFEKVPFGRLNDFQVGKDVTNGKRPELPHEGSENKLPDEIEELIQDMWSQEVENRPDGREVFQRLEEISMNMNSEDKKRIFPEKEIKT